MAHLYPVHINAYSIQMEAMPFFFKCIILGLFSYKMFGFFFRSKKFFRKRLFYTGLQLIDDIVLVSHVQQSDSFVHIYMYLFFIKVFSRLGCYRMLSSMCCRVGPCQLSTLNMYCVGFSGGSDGEESVCSVEDLGSIPGLKRFPWIRAWPPTPVFLPG